MLREHSVSLSVFVYAYLNNSQSQANEDDDEEIFGEPFSNSSCASLRQKPLPAELPSSKVTMVTGPVIKTTSAQK